MLHRDGVLLGLYEFFWCVNGVYEGIYRILIGVLYRFVARICKSYSGSSQGCTVGYTGGGAAISVVQTLQHPVPLTGHRMPEQVQNPQEPFTIVSLGIIFLNLCLYKTQENIKNIMFIVVLRGV